MDLSCLSFLNWFSKANVALSLNWLSKSLKYNKELYGFILWRLDVFKWLLIEVATDLF